MYLLVAMELEMQFTGTWYAKYSVGPVSFGYSNILTYDSGLAETAVIAETTSPAKASRNMQPVFLKLNTYVNCV